VNNWDYCRDNRFIGGHQVEFFQIKPLFSALVITIIEIGIPSESYNVEEQKVRLVRTGVTTGLSQPITFDGLTRLSTISENEVITTSPEAIRFAKDLDRREELLAPKRHVRVIEYMLGHPKVLFERWHMRKYSVFAKWAESDEALPVGTCE
jgi:hypothetical protein